MLPSRVDCIILGTGLVNSIFAAACSRIGKSVLHLDKNNYYGDDWASFTFQQLLDWIKRERSQDISLESVPEELVAKSRMFCIDLCPKLLLSDGAMVDLLVKSNVSRYHEFKNNIRILSIIGDDIHVIPCRRSEVFTSPILSNLTDKRKLMKFVELCMNFTPEGQNNGENTELEVGSPGQDSEIVLNAQKPIAEYLDQRGLKDTLREYIINSIAMVRPSDTTLLACQNIKKFMTATQRYGRSPFLMPMYGCGEFPQSFCRLSAVFGGVYCLNDQFTLTNGLLPKETPDQLFDGQQPSAKRPPKKLDNTEHSFSVLLSSNNHEVHSDRLVLDYNYGLSLRLIEELPLENKLSRAILITNRPIVQSDEEVVSFLRIPPSDTNNHYVHLLEFNSSVMVCPKGHNIVYLWTQASSSDPRSDLLRTVDRLYPRDKSECILWQFYYHQLTNIQTINYNKIDGLYITCPPSNDIDYDDSINEAQQLFHKIFPGEEFLPRAPDPDEIIST